MPGLVREAGAGGFSLTASYGKSKKEGMPCV
jgi:hypothetical protein